MDGNCTVLKITAELGPISGFPSASWIRSSSGATVDNQTPQARSGESSRPRCCGISGKGNANVGDHCNASASYTLERRSSGPLLLRSVRESGINYENSDDELTSGRSLLPSMSSGATSLPLAQPLCSGPAGKSETYRTAGGRAAGVALAGCIAERRRSPAPLLDASRT